VGSEEVSLVDETEVFTCLDASARAFIAARLEPLTVAGGDVLIRQGDDADALFLIAMGRLRVSMVLDDGTDAVIAERGRGEVVGEMALISNEPRSATVTAVRDTHVLRLPVDAFLAIVREHPEALRQLTTQFVRRLVQPAGHGPPTSPVVTVAVVPLDDDHDTLELHERLHRAFARLTGASSHVTLSAAAAVLGDLGDVSPDRLAAWFAQQEAGSDIVVYATDADPTPWTDACVRQADLILVVGSASGSPVVRPIEQAISGRRRHMPCRTELALVHPPHTSDPRKTRRWLEPRSVDRHHHVAADRDDDVDRMARLLLGRGVGVVFSGGGARGFASVGVLRALHELRVPIDAVGGTSVGSIIAGGVARGQRPEEIARIHKLAVVDTSPFDITFPAVSLASGKRVTRHLQESTDGLDLEDAWRNVFYVSTNLTRGQVEIHRRGPAWHAARASFSIPGVFPPVRSQAGDLLVDGGLLDNLPVGIMRAAHEGITVIAIDVGRSRDLVAGTMPGDGIVSGWEVLLRRLDPAHHRLGTASLGRILMRLTELGSERSDDLGDLYLRPPVDPFGIGDFKAFDRLAEVGYQHAARLIAAWLATSAAPSFLRTDERPVP